MDEQFSDDAEEPGTTRDRKARAGWRRNALHDALEAEHVAWLAQLRDHSDPAVTAAPGAAETGVPDGWFSGAC